MCSEGSVFDLTVIYGLRDKKGSHFGSDYLLMHLLYKQVRGHYIQVKCVRYVKHVACDMIRVISEVEISRSITKERSYSGPQEGSAETEKE